MIVHIRCGLFVEFSVVFFCCKAENINNDKIKLDYRGRVKWNEKNIDEILEIVSIALYTLPKRKKKMHRKFQTENKETNKHFGVIRVWP